MWNCPAPPAWSVIAASPVSDIASDSVGTGLSAWVDGAFIAAPDGRGIALEVVGETGSSALFTISCIFAMLELDRY